MRISDWSSDVCSSDLASPHHRHGVIQVSLLGVVRQRNAVAASILLEQACLSTIHFLSRYKNEPWRPQPATPQRSAPPGGTCPNHSWFTRLPRPDCLSLRAIYGAGLALPCPSACRPSAWSLRPPVRRRLCASGVLWPVS